MRRLWSIVLTALVWAAEAADAPLTTYDSDPAHLWNRLYRAIAVRTEGGTLYGVDNSEPYFDPFDDPKGLVTILDEFLSHQGENRASGDLRRALLLNDVWAAFDLAVAPALAGPESGAIRSRLARVIGRLRLSSAAISHLPDNYADAVKSGTFAADFDPEHPQQPFLPPDLLDPNGSWVQIQDGRGRPIAIRHVSDVSGRSVFRVFIRCPGGRQATLEYLEKLNLYPNPFELRAASIGTSYPSNQKVRMYPLRLNPETPQFPEGTIVALVRQMMVIDDKLEPVPTSITQKIQFRVYQKVGGQGTVVERSAFNGRQLAFEVVMRRRAVLAGIAGGLHAVTADEAEYQLTSIPMGGPRDSLLRGPVVLSMCRRCHSADGIFSVNSYGRSMSDPQGTADPQLLSWTYAFQQEGATVEWKKEQFNWGFLRGLLENTNN
jgi:hypothetical protein